MPQILHNIRFALRRITGNPGFSVIAVLSLALGIGANTLIFSIMNTFLFRVSPYSESGELVNIYRDREAFRYGPMSYPDYLELRDASSEIFDDLGGFRLVLTQRESDDRVEPLVGVLVTGNFFSLRDRLFDSPTRIVQLPVLPLLTSSILPSRSRPSFQNFIWG